MFTYPEGGPTTSLNYHLKTYHAHEYFKKDPEPTQTKQTKVLQYYSWINNKIDMVTPLSKEKKKYLDRLCHLWVVGNMRPYEVVEDRELQDWITAIDPRYKVPSVSTLSQMTPELMLKVDTKVRCRFNFSQIPD
jgi:hypothetical protein